MDVVVEEIAKQNLENIWDLVFQLFPIIENETQLESKLWHSDIFAISKQIQDHGIEKQVQELVEFRLESGILQVAEQFWASFPKKDEQLSSMDAFWKFKEIVNNLNNNLHGYRHVVHNMEQLLANNEQTLAYGETNFSDSFNVIVKSSLHATLETHSLKVIEQFYKVSFKVFINKDVDDSTEEVIKCSGCDYNMEHCICDEILKISLDVNSKLSNYDLLERLAGDILTGLIHERIETHVQETCKGSFDMSYIESLENWMNTVVMGWLVQIYGPRPDISKFKQKLLHLLYVTYTRTRIDQLFNIIIEYPDSQPAVEDLRICLEKTNLRSCLTQKLQKALETRLLHPGVNTTDVITAYIAAIKALRQLDPTGVLLETVTQPVRQYLRCREDTIRCVINSLIDDGPSELSEELVRSENLICDGSNVEEDCENWESWNPDPVDADSSKPSKSRRTSDVISMLVNVYGSKDLFVKEYTTLLAERLLSSCNYNTEKEHRYLELLKLRFGESHLHKCEVMLKDIYDSKRINSHMHCEANLKLVQQAFPTTAKILSAPFWPSFKEETVELPAFVKSQLDVYTKTFEKLKGNRTLSWKSHLGSVNMDIELKDRTVNVTVSPIKATIIWHFQTKEEWTVDELSSIILVPPTKLRREIAYWQSQGILKEISIDRFILVEESSGKTKTTLQTEMCDDDEVESVMASAHDQREEELQVFWSYVVGMLTNLESMPLERVYQMLKMFASQGPSSVDCNQQELRTFLDRKVREHKLLYSGGLYRLPKN